MTFPSAHYLLSYGGLLPGAETWTQGLRIWFEDMPANQAAELAALDDYAAALTTAWPAQILTGASTKLTWAKFNKIGVNGKYVNEYTNLHEFASPGISAQANGPVYPNQVSVVVSLLSSVQRGLACRGRLFFYAAGVAVDSDGRMTTTVRDNLVESAKDYIETINGATDGVVIIGSQVRSGALRLVESVKVGRVLDTMRSRRTSLAEDYAEEPIDLSAWTGGGGPF